MLHAPARDEQDDRLPVPTAPCNWRAIFVEFSWRPRVHDSVLRGTRRSSHAAKQAEARELLAPIYGWFTEGCDLADVQRAEALLKEPGGERTRV